VKDTQGYLVFDAKTFDDGDKLRDNGIYHNPFASKTTLLRNENLHASPSLPSLFLYLSPISCNFTENER